MWLKGHMKSYFPYLIFGQSLFIMGEVGSIWGGSKKYFDLVEGGGAGKKTFKILGCAAKSLCCYACIFWWKCWGGGGSENIWSSKGAPWTIVCVQRGASKCFKRCFPILTVPPPLLINNVFIINSTLKIGTCGFPEYGFILF